MDAQNPPPYQQWLDETKKKYRRHVQGRRLDRFVKYVESNPAFQSIYQDASTLRSQRTTGVLCTDDVPQEEEEDDYDVVDARLASTEQTSLEQDRIDLLVWAAKTGCFAPVKENLRHLVNKRIEDGTALHIAVENGSYEDVKALLEEKAEVSAVNERGLTPLHIAAASTEPNPEIAQLLIEHKMSGDTSAKHATVPETSDSVSTRGNTALHFAAANEHISRKFIKILQCVDPAIKNTEGETAFHVAAKAENPKVIVYMLKIFTPAKSGWVIADIENESGPTLLELCAKSGNAKAVALLIKYGASISQRVLVQLIDESVRNPTKTDKLIGVYRTITEHCVRSDWLAKKSEDREQHYPLLGTEPEAHRRKQRETMLKLLTERHGADRKLNVLQHAIIKGDKVFLNEIANTPHVFKISQNDNKGDDDIGKVTYRYDITGFIHSPVCYSKIRQIINYAMNRILGKQCATVCPEEQNHVNDDPIEVKSYLDLITQKEYEHLWKKTDVFQLEPFFTITRPICTFVQLFYFLMGMIQLVHMILFSVYYMPPSLKHQLNFKLSAKWNSSEIPSDPSTISVSSSSLIVNSFWLLWPTVIWFETFGVRMLRIKSRQIWYEFLTSRLVFAPLLWAWYFSTFVCHHFYLSLTSIVYLFGWLVTLSFFTAAFENASIFSFLLKEIIVKDILSSFGIVFFFVLVSFSSAIHLLRDKALLDQRDFFDTVYNVFASALTTGNFMDETAVESSDDKDRIHLLRAIFAIYLCCATIILLNLLICMMNNRYEEARKKAENVWTFRIVYTWIRLSEVFGFSLHDALLIFRIYWNIVTNKFWKQLFNTRYHEVEVSIGAAEDGDKVYLCLKYRLTA